MVDPEAEVITRETDPFATQILAGLIPYKIHVDLEDGMLQLPAEISVTWPPSESEGIQEGTPDYIEYFVWAKSEKDALLRISRINKADAKATSEAVA
jgi:hypothetical protein